MSEEATEKVSFIQQLPWYAVPATLLGVPALVALLALIAPETFYDNFVWKYYWGPIKADAAGRTLIHGGVEAHGGYNLVNTLTWAALMGTCLVGLTQLVNGLKLKMNNTFILGATGWVVAGAVWHVLEDTDLFRTPLQYFFITPPIYLLFGLFGVLAILVGKGARDLAAERGIDAGLQRIWLTLSALVLLYTLAWVAEWSQIRAYVNPVGPAILAAITFLVIRMRVMRVGRIVPEEIMLILSLWPLLSSMDWIRLFLADAWTKANGIAHNTADAMPSAVIIAPLGALLIAMLIRAIAKARHAKSGGEISNAFMQPINLVLIGSQLTDAISTALGVDLIGTYDEKHVVSGFLIDWWRTFAENIGFAFGAEHPTFFAFLPVKLLVAMGVVYAIDVYSKEDVQKHPAFIGFVKFAIIMVGIGPGVRNFTRMALGV